jgi:hypothetical protein
MSNVASRSLWLIGALCILNFMAFFVIAGGIGGDAANGKIVNGHFFLGDHGRFTEVTQAIFNYSKWHVRSLFLTQPLGMLLLFIAGKEFKRRNPAMQSLSGK